MSWRLILVFVVCLFITGCTTGYRPLPGDAAGPVHGDPGGGSGGM